MDGVVVAVATTEEESTITSRLIRMVQNIKNEDSHPGRGDVSEL